MQYLVAGASFQLEYLISSVAIVPQSNYKKNLQNSKKI